MFTLINTPGFKQMKIRGDHNILETFLAYFLLVNQSNIKKCKQNLIPIYIWYKYERNPIG